MFSPDLQMNFIQCSDPPRLLKLCCQRIRIIILFIVWTRPDYSKYVVSGSENEFYTMLRTGWINQNKLSPDPSIILFDARTRPDYSKYVVSGSENEFYTMLRTGRINQNKLSPDPSIILFDAQTRPDNSKYVVAGSEH